MFAMWDPELCISKMEIFPTDCVLRNNYTRCCPKQ